MQLDPFFVTARSIIVIVRACRSHTTSISSTTPPPFPVDPSALTATAPHPPPSSPPSRIQVVDAFVRSPAPRPCRQVINRCDNGHPLLLLLRNRASLLLASSLHHSRPLLLVVVDVAIARPTFRINRNRRPIASLPSLLLLLASRPLLPCAWNIPVASCHVVSRCRRCRRPKPVASPSSTPFHYHCLLIVVCYTFRLPARMRRSSPPSRPAYSVASHHCLPRHRRPSTRRTPRSILPIDTTIHSSVRAVAGMAR